MKTVSDNSTSQQHAQESLVSLFKESPIPDDEILANLGVYSNRQLMSHFVFIHHVYQQIINTHGVIMELGCRWGQNLALFETMRALYEPYNYSRKIIGFDTFGGFPSVHKKDGGSSVIEEGAYGVTGDYEKHLEQVLNAHEQNAPLDHLKKFELVKGDAIKTVPTYLEHHPETIISLAYFDFDLYEPTLACLKAIQPYLTKGSVIVFDELNSTHFPGETVAVREALGMNNIAIKRLPINTLPSYIVVE